MTLKQSTGVTVETTQGADADTYNANHPWQVLQVRVSKSGSRREKVTLREDKSW